MTDIKILPIMYMPYTYHGVELNSFENNLKDENGVISESITDKLSLLHGVFKKILNSKEYQSFFNKHQKNSISILTLPEYFFNLKSYPSSFSELKDILNGIASIIPKSEKILFVAGTIPWYRKENNIIKVYICAPVFYRGKLIFATSKLKTIGDHQLSKSQKAKTEISGLLESWGFSVDNNNYRPKIEFDTSDSRKLRLQKLKGFNKDFSEKFKLENSDFIKLKVGDKTLKIGLEICADQCFGRLMNNSSVPELDIHIIIACGTSYKKSSIMARKGGYVIVCDGSAGYEIGVLKCISKITLKEARKYNLEMDSLRISLNEKNEIMLKEPDPQKRKELRKECKQLKDDLKSHEDTMQKEFDSLDFECDVDTYIKKSQSEIIFDAQCELRFNKPRFFKEITLSEPENFVKSIQSVFSLDKNQK